MSMEPGVVHGEIGRMKRHYRYLLYSFVLAELSFIAEVSPCHAQVYERIVSFDQAVSKPRGLILGIDGSFYGAMTNDGNNGGIFKVTPGGDLTVIARFSGDNPPKNPVGKLTRLSDGSLLGVSHEGGEHDLGTVFKMAPSGLISTLASFDSTTGTRPVAGMVQASDGNLYGTTRDGGSGGRGTIFKITPTGTLSILVNFNGTNGSHPKGELVQASDGNIYGTTSEGGSNDLGTIFKVSPMGSFEVVLSFTGSISGRSSFWSQPGLTVGSDGNFYGVTCHGGSTNRGMVFRITPNGQMTILTSFSGETGERPVEELIEGSDGALYGMTQDAGNFNAGTIFKVTKLGAMSVLSHFGGTGVGSGNDRGTEPLVQGVDGNFYGASFNAGFDTGLKGKIYRVTPSGILSTVYDFSNGSGRSPVGRMAEDDHGNFYGTTFFGGTYNYGTIFRVEPSGMTSTLINFNHSNGRYPIGVLTRDSEDSFVGVTQWGGPFDKGTVFRLKANGDFSMLATFIGINGYEPTGIIQGSDGSFYGMTRRGGSSDLGTVFRMSSSGILTTLATFDGANGSRPRAGLVEGNDGAFYGVTQYGGSAGMGTAFRITPAGILTTLFSFDGANGSYPSCNLIQHSDGSLYGTTQGGGDSNMGTVFKIAASGEHSVIVHFSGSDGSLPFSGLTLGKDGYLYGSTLLGGSANLGGVFRISPNGSLMTILDFAIDPEASQMQSDLVEGEDGNLYGATLNVIFRLLTQGSPIVGTEAPSSIGSDSAILAGRVNARGLGTSIMIDYGTDTEHFSSIGCFPSPVGDFFTRPVSASLSNLQQNTTYYYRIRAINSAGTTSSVIRSFVTLPLPMSAASFATEIGKTSATLLGRVNGRGIDTSLNIELGTDSFTFPIRIATIPAIASGDVETGVSGSVSGLQPGTTYYYRVVATNASGTSVSGTQTFRTLTDPVPTVGGSFALSTTSVRVEGSVDPDGSSTTVVFEYGTDGVNFPNSVAAAQGAQSGSGNRPVSAVLTNLAQGITYHYRLRATSDGGVGVSETATFSMNVLSGFTRVHPGPPPESDGFLTVNLLPPGLLYGWRFVGEQEWRLSGVPATGLATGRYQVEFKPTPGYITPFPLIDSDGDDDGMNEISEAVEVFSGAAPTVVERRYFENGNTDSGGLSVILKPDSITSGDDRAQWRLLGEGDSAWRDSGAFLPGLPAGTYLVECKPVAGRATPSNASVLVAAGQTAAPTVTYFLPGAESGELPAALSFEAVTSDGESAFAQIGQLRSSAGAGTGFVVKERVVATAAHVVWDDGTLAAASGVQWLYQRHRGLHEPVPRTPRGFYFLTGYDAQRQVEDSPGTFSPQSRNRDVAALYFTEDAARGGYGGFLASDLEENEFLLSNADKILAGYPVDGIAPASRGRMHATAPFDVHFEPVPFTPASEGERRCLFLTTDIRSSGGASGGPLLVQFEGGPYYPAAIYLGGSTQSIFRSIDSRVIDLFNLAEESGIDGEPHTGGGITHTGVTPIGGAGTPGALKVTLAPAGAVTAGAGWRLRPETGYRTSGAQQGNLNAGRYVLELSTVDGYQTPSSEHIRVEGGQLKTITFTYALAASPAAEISVTGNSRNLPDGDATPSPLDGTDFGVVDVAGGMTTRSFTIRNTGSATLSVGSVVIGGAHSDDFSLSVSPGDSVPPGGSTSFTVLFDPSAAGTRTATVSFATNDSDENPFNFAIQGNDTTDSNSDGFSDLEESALAELLASFTIGQTVDLDLSFLRLGTGQVLELFNLPPGLNFNPATQRITGTITAKAASPQVEIRKRDGATVVATVTHGFPVFTPATVTVTGLRPFPATAIGRRSRPQTVRVTNSGELALNGLSVKTTGRAAREFLPSQPAAKTLSPGASTTFTMTFKPRTKGTRSANVTVFSNVAPKSLPVSGRGIGIP